MTPPLPTPCPATRPLTEKQLAEDFERINKVVQEKVCRYTVDEFPPLIPVEDDSIVVEPVYAYEVHASS